MRNQDSIDDTTPLQNVTVSIPKEYNQGKDDNKENNLKDLIINLKKNTLTEIKIICYESKIFKNKIENILNNNYYRM